ncbi:DUF456 family protein [Alienimonas californiensis]|uniref:DUF456 domain-containing protein n=1 Tax=Alienimonas californiensis TaxID=2527989 RepID=A0A517P8C3_9PLAN|nr:DUF456 family protein [Alienimonas californiensis]QDT15617.1 hypothetical protein CA12_17020 [Alienimonas californiensis]
MDPTAFYFTLAVPMVLLAAFCWASTLFTLPGNWAVLALAAAWAYFMPKDEYGWGFGWGTVAVLAGLALIGEALEFAAGAAGAKKEGGSRRGMALSILGAMVGSLAGAAVGVPVPVVGPLIGAVGGGAAGAFAGAYLGETWKGRHSRDAVQIGKGALIGRLVGTGGKLACGAVMVAVLGVMTFVPRDVATPLDDAVDDAVVEAEVF